MTDPFEQLRRPHEAVAPDPTFARQLRSRLATLLAVEQITPPTRRTPMATDTNLPRHTAAGAATPYLAVHDGAAALAFYAEAFGAVEAMRILMDDGRVGHAEFRVAGARFYLSDEYPEMGVHSPRSLGGTTVTLHLEVDDVDARFAAAVDAGATSLGEPADQPHGARHGTLADPFGHRWMLSQTVETLTGDELTARMADGGAAVVLATEPAMPRPQGSGIWAGLPYEDALAGIRFATEVLGFEAQLVVPGAEEHVVEHSQLVWPEGGIVQIATAHRDGNEFSAQATGAASLYVITADPRAVWERCVAAGVSVVSEPAAPGYDPDGLVFSIRDFEGNLWSFGTYAGEG